jgi:hypothetical protein
VVGDVFCGIPCIHLSLMCTCSSLALLFPDVTIRRCIKSWQVRTVVRFSQPRTVRVALLCCLLAFVSIIFIFSPRSFEPGDIYMVSCSLQLLSRTCNGILSLLTRLMLKKFWVHCKRCSIRINFKSNYSTNAIIWYQRDCFSLLYVRPSAIVVLTIVGRRPSTEHDSSETIKNFMYGTLNPVR